jgi:hypothetical protein
MREAVVVASSRTPLAKSCGGQGAAGLFELGG